jgi:hypothetical protein
MLGNLIVVVCKEGILKPVIRNENLCFIIIMVLQ